MKINITEEEIIAIEKILDMYMGDEERHWEEMPEESQLDRLAKSTHIYYNLGVLLKMLNRIKEGK